MAKIKHTPEPWEAVSFSNPPSYVRNKEGLILARMRDMDGLIDHKANAERIVACVNAMAGIENPQKLREAWEVCKDLELDQAQRYKEERDRMKELVVRIRNSGVIAPAGKLWDRITKAIDASETPTTISTN